LSELFDNADDTLFEKADRASSNADQSLFFDAMRLLRLQRHAMRKAAVMAWNGSSPHCRAAAPALPRMANPSMWIPSAWSSRMSL
ncbi:DUF1631 domain-containing protein, partial [Halopseudomonas bauzanensis]